MHADNSIAKAGRPRVQLHLAFRNFRRELTLPPALALTSVGLVVALLVSCLGVGAWPMLRDDMLASLLRRQVRMQRAYEDRIADLGAQIDALSSRQRQDREAFELRVTEFAARQAQLETRTDRVAAIAAQVNPAAQFNAATTAIAIVARPALAKPAASARPAATAAFAPDGFDLRRTHPLDPPREDVSENAPPAPPEKSIGDLTRNFDRIEQRQIAALGSLSAPAAARAKRLRQAFDEAGLPVERLMRHADGFGAEKAGGAGGPFEPAPIEQCAKKWTPIFRKNIAKIKESSVDCDSSESQSTLEADAFEHAFASVSQSLALVDGLRRALPHAPVRQPMTGPLDVTSSFGFRTDPFLGRPALHSGVDLRGDIGDLVRATAAGRVVVAGPSGGYGNLVEIDHGAGLATRYGHLSQIAVDDGQWVEAGAFLGEIGSTGRSTGPHLHYEVRVDGAAVDPARYLRAGRLLNSAP